MEGGEATAGAGAPPAAAVAAGLDYEKVAEEACRFMRDRVGAARAGGVVFGLSGGIDSSVVAHLAARALGPEKCLALVMPNESFTPDSETDDGVLVAKKLGIRHMKIPIGRLSGEAERAASAAGCGEPLDAPVRVRDGMTEFQNTFGPPHLGNSWIPLSSILSGMDIGTLKEGALPPNVLRTALGIAARDGEGSIASLDDDYVRGSIAEQVERRKRVAVGNLNARLRAMLLYLVAQLNNYLVAGTDDRSEYLIGYFTKYGDGASDLLPIADLYKTQVQRLGRHLGVPAHIVKKAPSPHLWKDHDAAAELGAGYGDIDAVLAGAARRRRGAGVVIDEKRADRAAKAAGVGAGVVQAVVRLNTASAHKRALPPIARLRRTCAAAREEAAETEEGGGGGGGKGAA